MRPLDWVGSSYRDYKRFPRSVQEEMGFALYLAQRGARHPIATPRSEIDLVRRRLRMAREDYLERRGTADARAKGNHGDE